MKRPDAEKTPREDEVRESYDKLPYPSLPWRFSHPVHLATLSILHGLAAAPASACRLLDVGCSDGGNLLPLAAAYPESEFVGVDLSPAQVDAGRATIRSAGLTNVRLEAMSLVEIGPDFGEFDYVTAHGVLSWVPEDVRDALFGVCRDRLSPRGVAFLSYNTYPGWHLRQMVREILFEHTREVRDLSERVSPALSFLEFLAEEEPGRGRAYSLCLDEVLRLVRASEQEVHYFAHEFLEVENRPLYFRRFAERAARHGLSYAADAQPELANFDNLPREKVERLLSFGDDRITVEQNLDYVRGRLFRQSILCREGRDVLVAPDLGRVADMHFAGCLKLENGELDPDTPGFEVFLDESGASTRVAHPLSKAALVVLGELWPMALSLPDLAAAARERLTAPEGEAGDPRILAAVLGTVWSTGLLEVQATPYPFTWKIAPRPRTSPLARHQAGLGGNVTNLRHERVALEDDTTRRVLGLLDGTRERGDLLEKLPGLASSAELEAALRWIAGMSLLTE